MSNLQFLSALIWSVANDMLRGLFKPHEYGDVILPFVILKRLDCVLEPRKDEIYRLFLLIEKFTAVDLNTNTVGNHTGRRVQNAKCKVQNQKYRLPLVPCTFDFPGTADDLSSDLLISSENPDHIKLGSSLSKGGFTGEKFDYMITNPLFGVSWKSDSAFVTGESQKSHGKFTAGTPRISDGSLLFLQHMFY